MHDVEICAATPQTDPYSHAHDFERKNKQVYKYQLAD